MYIEVSFVLSFSSGEAPNPQINHGAKYYWEGAFSDFFQKKIKEKKERTNKKNLEKKKNIT